MRMRVKNLIPLDLAALERAEKP